MKFLKGKIILLFLILIIFSTAFAAAYIYDVSGRSESGDVKIHWRTQQETNLNHFAVERKSGTQGSYVEIGTMNPKGDNSIYEFTDRSAYKTNDIFFIYRIKIVDENKQVSYSEEIPIHPVISGVKRTWGSIKALFR